MDMVKHKIANSLLGFSAGLPFLFTLSILQLLLVENNISIETIGVLGLVQLPYSLKFLWAWVFDRYSLFKTKFKNNWLYLVQILIIANFWFIGSSGDIYAQIVGFFILGFLSATQDILIDYFRVETSSDDNIALHSSLYVLFYRLALILVGSVGFILADQYSFELMFKVFGSLMGLGLIGTFLLPKIQASKIPETINYKEIFTSYFLLLIAFLIAYKLGDQFADKLNIVYFKELGYSTTDIGIVKALTSWGVVAGGLLAGVIMKFTSLRKSLYIFGGLQVLSTFGYFLLSFLPVGYIYLGIIWSFEKITAGMGSIALISFMSLKSKELGFTSFYFTVFTSVITFSLTLFSSSSGFLVELLGWEMFFVVCCVFSVPGLVLISKVLPEN